MAVYSKLLPNEDYIDKVFEYYRFIIAAWIGYTAAIQYLEGNRQIAFLGVAGIYMLWHLLSGLYYLRRKTSERSESYSAHVLRFVFNVLTALALLHFGGGAFEYYLLLFPWIIILNFYIFEKKIDEAYSAMAAVLVATAYFAIQYRFLHESWVEVSSTFVKSFLLVAASYLSYWFWKNRFSYLNYVETIDQMHEVGHALTTATSSKGVLQEIVKSAFGALGADVVTIIPYDQRRNEFQLPPLIHGSLLNPEYKRIAIRPNDVAYIMIREKRSIFATDAQANETFARSGRHKYEGQSDQPFVFREKIKSTAGLLLQVGNESVGVMFINYRSPHTFFEREKGVLRIYANYAAIAIKNVREKEALLQKVAFSATKILDIKSLLGNLPVAERENAIIRLVLNESCRLLDEKNAYYASCLEGGKMLMIEFSTPSYKQLLHHQYSIETGMTGKAARTRAIQIMNRIGDQPEFIRFSESTELEVSTSVDDNVKSAIAVPLLQGAHVLGVFMIESDYEANFSELDIQIVQALVEQAATAIANIRLLNQLESKQAFLQKLREIDKQILDANFDLRHTLHIILQSALGLAGAERGSILKRISEKQLEVTESTAMNSIGQILDIHDSVSGLAFLESRTIYVPDLETDLQMKSRYKQLLGEGARSELVVPLNAKGELLGALNIESRKLDAFTEDHIRNLETLAGQAAIAIQNASLFDDNKRRREELTALREIDRAILDSSLDLPNTLNVVLSKALALVNAHHGDILLFNENSKQLEVVKSARSQDEGLTLALDECVSGLAVKNRQTVYKENLDKEPLFKPYVDQDVKSELAVPLQVDGKVIGVLNAESTKYDAFTVDHISLLENLSGAAAIAIVNAQRYEEVGRARDKLQNSINLEVFMGFLRMNQIFEHRISNSVGMIKVMADELFEKKERLDPASVNAVQTIQRNAVKALDFRNEATTKGSYMLYSERTPIKMSKIVKDIMSNEEFVHNKALRIVHDDLDKLPTVEANYDLLVEGVFNELIRNAVKAMPHGGQITLSGEKIDDQHVRITIADTGCGIDERDLDNIFKHGFTQWRGGSGTGKGLFYIKSIVNFFRGDIVCNSRLGQGSAFVLTLPIAKG
jgi:GAF domain-containing protein/two-component sensor histidine kinase